MTARPSRAWMALLACGALAACAGSEPPLWDQPPRPGVDGPVVQSGALHRAELDNGLSLIVLEDHRLPRIQLGLAVRRGSASVPAEEAGLAAFTAELMERGAGERDALALAEAVDALGGSLSVSSGWDLMAVQLFGLSRDADPLLDVLADVVLRPRFDPSEAEKTRSETLAALERAKDSPRTLGRWALLRALYPGARAGLPRAGTPETVARFGAQSAREFHARIFVPNASVLYAVGDVDPDVLLERVGAALGSWPAGPVPEPGPVLPTPVPAQRTVVVVDRPDLAQAHITLAHEGLARTDPRRVAAGLLDTVVGGGGFSSRLMEAVRSEAGLAYGVSSGFSLRRGGGTYSVSTSTRVAEARRAVDLLLSELERARREPPTEDELARAKVLLTGGFALGLETSDAVMASLLDLDIHGLPEDSLDTYRGRIRATTTQQTAELALELLHPGRAALVVVGPAADLVPQLEDLGSLRVERP